LLIAPRVYIFVAVPIVICAFVHALIFANEIRLGFARSLGRFARRRAPLLVFRLACLILPFSLVVVVFERRRIGELVRARGGG
jgi:hypothetical protein